MKSFHIDDIAGKDYFVHIEMISISINTIDTYFHAMFYSIDNQRHSVAIITTIKNNKCNKFIYILSNYDQMTFWSRFTYLFLQIESELCYF